MSKNKNLKNLYFISFIAGIIAVFIFRRNLAAEASMLGYFGYIPKEVLDAPVSASVVTKLFSIPLAGFVFFNFFDIINVALVAVLFIPVLYLCYGIKKWIGTTGAILLLGCLCLYIISNMALPLFFNLGDNEKLDSLLQNSDFYFVQSEISLLLFYSFGLFITAAMKRYSVFSKYTFVFGLLTNLIGLFYFPLIFIIGELRYLAIVFAAPFTVIWHMNIAVNLFKNGKHL